MPDHDDNLHVELIFSLDFNDLGGLKNVHIEAETPEEQRQAAAMLETTLDKLASVRSIQELPTPTNLRGNKTILEVWELYKTQQLAIGRQSDVRGGWKNPGRVNVEQFVHVQAFIDFIGGDRPISAVREDDVLAFRSHVMATDQINSAGSRKSRLNRSGALFKFAKDEKYIRDSFPDAFRFKGQIKKNSFLKFSPADLLALFESETYRLHQHGTTSQYWLPLLGLFSGARLNELCQLLKSDIRHIEGIPVLAILDEEECKRLKTDAARRYVPVHSKLIELGFLDFVASLPNGRVFPHLRENSEKPGDFAPKATEDFMTYRRSVGVGKQEGEGKSQKVFHSFRTTFIWALRQAKVPQERRTRLVGHEYEDTHNGTYDGGDVLDMFHISTLKDDVEQVCFDVTFTPYRPFA